MMNYSWKNPKKPTITSGYLVIESDDGKASDYGWVEMAEKIAHKHSQFIPSRAIPFTLNLNTGTIGEVGRLTVAQLQELNKKGWEMGGHGKYHIGFATHPLATNAEISDTVLNIQFPYFLFGNTGLVNGYTYKIYDDTNSDEFEILITSDSDTTGNITIDTPITHAYNTITAKVQMTDESIEELLMGVKDDLAGWGIKCHGHAFTWHSASQYGYNPDGVEIVRNINGSGRGVVVSEPNDQNTDKCLLHSRTTTYSKDNEATLLADTVANGRLTIVYGHGEEKGMNPPYWGLATLIEGAINAGIRVTTRSKAIAGFFGS